MHILRSFLLINTLTIIAISSAFTHALAFDEIPTSADQRYEAAIVSDLTTTLSSRVSGYIQNVSIKQGDTFAKGDVLVKLDCGIHSAEQKKVKAEIRGAEATLSSKKQLKELKSVSEIDVILAEVEVEKLNAEHERLQEIINGCTIKAPVDAVAVDIHAQNFQTVDQGEPLITMMTQNKLRVEFFVPSSETRKISEIENVELFVNETKQRYTISVAKVVPNIDPVSQTLKVIGHFKTENNNLLPGMTGIISVPRL